MQPTPSRLLSLPPGLRNPIWKFAVSSFSAQTLHDEPTLLRTCKQIRREARAMYYRHNTFYIPLRRSQLHTLPIQLQKLGWIAGSNLKDLTISIPQLADAGLCVSGMIGQDLRTYLLRPESVHIACPGFARKFFEETLTERMREAMRRGRRLVGNCQTFDFGWVVGEL